jgi:translation initiation factor IF-3
LRSFRAVHPFYSKVRLRRPYIPPQGPRQEPQRKHKINDEISAPEVRVVDAQGSPLGVLPRREALSIALEREVDLVEIAPQANPPVCKIIDYGKFIYEQTKREKQQKKAQTHSTLKEVRFKAGTDTHDFDFKTRHAREFLEEGHKVKATVMFKGREILHKELGEELLQRFIDALADVAKIDQPMRMEGRFLGVMLAPDIKKPVKKKEPKPAEAGEGSTPQEAQQSVEE